MRILFVLRTAGYFPYHQTTIDHLLQRGHHVTLLFEPVVNTSGPTDDHGFQEWLTRAPRASLVVGQAVQRQDAWRRLLFRVREIRSYASYCRRGKDVTFYRERWRQYALPRLGRLARDGVVGRAVFRSPLTGWLLGAAERVAPASRQIVAALRRDRPDRVVASPANLRFDEEIEYVKAAKALGIPSIVPVLTWDNLTTKGLFHVQPDLVLAWHHGHHEEARGIHRVPANRIVVTGSPFFDKWFDTRASVSSRAVTCRRIGLDPALTYLLYLGSSSNVARDESWLVIELVRVLREAADPALRQLQVAFKPHPANLRAVPRLVEAGVAVWPLERGRPDTTQQVEQFRDMLHHAAAVIGINTTGMVDAILCDRPCVALEVKRYRDTQSRATHFRRIRESQALSVTGSLPGALKILGRILSGEDRKAGARRRFATTYARPRGLAAQAGEAAAIAIELASTRASADQITGAIDRALTARPSLAPDAVGC